MKQLAFYTCLALMAFPTLSRGSDDPFKKYEGCYVDVSPHASSLTNATLTFEPSNCPMNMGTLHFQASFYSSNGGFDGGIGFDTRMPVKGVINQGSNGVSFNYRGAGTATCAEDLSVYIIDAIKVVENSDQTLTIHWGSEECSGSGPVSPEDVCKHHTPPDSSMTLKRNADCVPT